jgi:hypothetical protein
VRGCNRLGPGGAEDVDLFGLQLVEGNAGVLGEQGGAHQVHAVLSAPAAGGSGRLAPVDALSQAGDLGLDRQLPGCAHRRVAVGDVCAADGLEGAMGVLVGRLGLPAAGGRGVAEDVRAVEGVLGSSTGDPELQSPAGDDVGLCCLRRHVAGVW